LLSAIGLCITLTGWLCRADTEHTTRREHGEHRRPGRRRGAGLPGRRGVPGGEREVAPGPRAAGRGGLGVHLQHGAQQRPQPVGGVPAGTVEPILQLRLICDFVSMYFRFLPPVAPMFVVRFCYRDHVQYRIKESSQPHFRQQEAFWKIQITHDRISSSEKKRIKCTLLSLLLMLFH
jgi:hypothetical protein